MKLYSGPDEHTQPDDTFRPAQASEVFANAQELHEQLLEEHKDLTYKVAWLIKKYVDLEDGVFTFPNGDSWDVSYMKDESV